MGYIVQNSMEANGSRRNILETTVSYKVRTRLTPTLTHVITYELVTSGAEDRAMSCTPSPSAASLTLCLRPIPLCPCLHVNSYAPCELRQFPQPLLCDDAPMPRARICIPLLVPSPRYTAHLKHKQRVLFLVFRYCTCINIY